MKYKNVQAMHEIRLAVVTAVSLGIILDNHFRNHPESAVAFRNKVESVKAKFEDWKDKRKKKTIKVTIIHED